MTERGDFTILVADDEEGMRVGLEKALSLEGYRVLTAATGAEVRAISRRERLNCAFVDLRLPDVGGIDLVPSLLAGQAEVVVITAYATVDTAVTAMKLGAIDYIQKPFDNQDIVEMADRLFVRSDGVRTTDSIVVGDNELVVRSAEMRDIVGVLQKVKDSDIPVLLQGESGTGKEMLANLIHREGSRSRQPFVAINCAAIPAELLESELFGHEKGAFTGALAARIGRFEAAGAGTIFLDEIGDMSLNLQTKLLRALEERSFEPVGATRSIPLRARVVASTNCDLSQLIREKLFRLDLYYRLKGVSVTIPALRDRREDIEPLVNLFLLRYRTRYQKPLVEISREAFRHLRSYSWPGNVRELKNAVESAVLLCDGERSLLPQDFMLEGSPETIVPELWRQEKDSIIDVLTRTGFNRTLASRHLGMSRRTLYDKMKKYGIH